MSSLIGQVFTALSRWVLMPPSAPDIKQGRFDSYGKWESRVQRYDVFWSFYSNTAYSDAHSWGTQFKSLYGLYKYTRGCYNPLFRLGELWSRAIWPGKLDNRQLSGRVIQSAAPLLTGDNDLREAVGRLWRDSNWQSQKDIVCRFGSVMGDVGIKIEDDPQAGLVRMVPVHPGSIRWIKMDRQRRVLAYEIWEYRFDPRYDPRTDSVTPGAGEHAVLYKEKAQLVDPSPNGKGGVHYETFLNDELYPWNGMAAQWDKDYAEIPLILHSHMPWLPGYYWGMSEYQAALAKSVELDDLGSKHHDQIRKASDPKWLLAGVSKPENPAKVLGGDLGGDGKASRTELPFFYAPSGATAIPMVFPLDNQFVSVETQNQLHALEQDYPELRFDAARVSGDASAKALREIRKSAEQKVQSRRSDYDNTLVLAQKIALAIGGERGYPGYEPAGLGWAAYRDGGLDHWIGERSVFQVDPLDRIEEEAALYLAWQTAKNAGVPDRVIMERLDWTEEEMKLFLQYKQEEQQKEMDRQASLAKVMAPPSSAGNNTTNQPGS